MKYLIPFAFLGLIQECGSSEGDIEAYMLLQSDDGEIRYFSLGNRNTFSDCAEMALVEFEDVDWERRAFWVNPEFTYGGFRAGNEDWIPYRRIGFSCSRPKPEDDEPFPD